MPTVLPELDERKNNSSYESSNRNGHFSNARNYGSGFGKGRNQGPRGMKRFSKDDNNQWNDRKRPKYDASY